MNKRRRKRPGAALPGLILLGVAAVALLLLTIGLGRGLLGLLNLVKSDGGELEPDPMFAEETQEQIEAPAELGESGTAPDLGDDPSQNWVYEDLTPVEQTAAELALEAQTTE